MPFSSTSFWRGLHFAVQTHLGRVAASLHILSAPLDEVQPSASCWGSSGATPGRGCVRFPHVQANYELSHGGCRREAERVRCAAHLHARMHITSAHTHACTIIITDYECDARARLAPRLRVISAISACVILAGSFFLRTISHVRSVQCTRISVHMCAVRAMCEYYYMIMC